MEIHSFTKFISVFTVECKFQDGFTCSLGFRHSTESNQLNQSTGIPRFTLLMWGHKNKTAEAKTV